MVMVALPACLHWGPAMEISNAVYIHQISPKTGTMLDLSREFTEPRPHMLVLPLPYSFSPLKSLLE